MLTQQEVTLFGPAFSRCCIFSLPEQSCDTVCRRHYHVISCGLSTLSCKRIWMNEMNHRQQNIRYKMLSMEYPI